MIQVAVKNNVGVFYFGTTIPMNVYFAEDGAMGKYTLVCTHRSVILFFCEVRLRMSTG